MNLNKNKIKYICSVIFIFYTSALYSQFILPEDRYTTQKDIDVIRINDDGIDVKNIRAIAKKNSQGEVEISWRYVKNSVPVAVIRNDRAMSNMSLLKLGKIINILDAGQVTLKDTIVTPGDYYYAVVSYQKFKEESTMLKLDENYTSIPIHFDESDLNSNIKLKKEYVENIKAEALDNKTVRIRWNFEPVPNVNLLIYKSTSEINNESKLKTSTRIGTVASEKNYFDDENDSSGDFFYAVTVSNQFEIEKFIFIANQNYTTIPVKKPEITSSTVKSLRADKKKDTNEVVLTWNDPSAKYTSEYIIYRSNQKMLQEIDLQNATIIQRAAQYSVSYTDKESPEGDVYYAVLTQNKQGTIQKNLIADENTLTHPVPAAEITPEKKPEPEAEAETEPESKQGLIYDMQATTERNMVFISWIPDSELYKQLPPKGVYYHIFRFNHEPASIDELAGAHYIAKVAINEESYHDIPDKDGIYYYAIFIATPKGVLPDNLIYGDNLVGPVIYKKGANKVKVGRENGEKEIDSSIFDDTSKLSEEKINNILRRSYLQENYKEALEALQDFRHSPNRKVRARATFYSALSSYYLGNYRQAMDLIMDESVKSVYAERADFWYRQILEKITK